LARGIVRRGSAPRENHSQCEQDQPEHQEATGGLSQFPPSGCPLLRPNDLARTWDTIWQLGRPHGGNPSAPRTPDGGNACLIPGAKQDGVRNCQSQHMVHHLGKFTILQQAHGSDGNPLALGITACAGSLVENHPERNRLVYTRLAWFFGYT